MYGKNGTYSQALSLYKVQIETQLIFNFIIKGLKYGKQLNFIKNNQVH